VKKSELMQIIREEVEVVLTDEEAIEMFDLDPAALLEVMLGEADGKGCAKSQGGSGCIRKRDGKWVIMNNKKGGIWRKCDSRAHCEEILDAYYAAKG
tara:strand:+ start:362 stop:652 length:291 start_codon:yes stop_codon:yes gene_type:complete